MGQKDRDIKKSKPELIAELDRLQAELAELNKEQSMPLPEDRMTGPSYFDLFNNSPDMTLSVSPTDGRIIECNNAVIECTGYIRDELIGEEILKIYHEDCLDQVRANLEIFNRNGILRDKEMVLKTKSGDRVEVELNVNAKRDASGRILYSISTLRDIRERKQAENTLRENENLLRKIAENYPNSFLSVINRDFGVGFTGGQEFKKLNLDPNKFVGMTLEMIFRDKAPLVKDYYQRTFKGEESQFELFFNNQHQLYRTVPLYSKDGSINAILSVVENITQRKKLEEELQYSYEQMMVLKEKAEESNLLKSQFLANMSHDIRTPINAIMGFTNLLLKNESREETRRFLDKIKHAGDGLMNIINDILDLSKIEAGQLDIIKDSFSVSELIEGIRDMFQIQVVKKNLRFDIRKAEQVPPFAYNDRWRINQIIANLIGNAIKFTDRGTIFFTLSYHSRLDLLVFKVKDTGIGIDAEDLGLIFEPFIQLGMLNKNVEKGSGLGLAISKKLSQLLGGDISVQSQVGMGTEFVLEIPANSDRVTEANESRQKPVQIRFENIRNQKILIAEDNPVNMELIHEQFREAGFNNVLFAENGQEAVDIGLREMPDLILMDNQMPVMNGNEAIQELKQQGFTNPIITLSAFAMREDIELSIKAGAVDYITKPIDFDHFFPKIAAYLQSGEKIESESIHPDSMTEEQSNKEAEAFQIDQRISDQLRMVFLADLDEKRAQLGNIASADLNENSLDVIRKIAYSYRTNASHFGFTYLAETATELDQLIIDNGDQNRIRALIIRLRSILDKIRHFNPD